MNMEQMEQELFSGEETLKHKVRLGEYPYTFVRVIVMRTALFKKHDYDKVLKMSLAEISRFMQDSSYREEITYFGSRCQGIDLIERATAMSLEKTFSKLRSISSPELRILIDLYLGRYDYSNCKAILRGIFAGEPITSVKDCLFFVGAFGQKSFEGMLQASSVTEGIEKMPFAGKQDKKFLIGLYEKSKNLIAIENFLDKRYYLGILQVLPLLSRAGALFREFLMEEIFVLDFLTALKLKGKGVPQGDIEKYFLGGSQTSPKGKQIHEKIRTIIKSNIQNTEELLKLLRNSPFGDITNGIIEKGRISLGQIEISLYSYLLKKTLVLQHQHPLSVDVILGFMFAKEIEARNIRMIAKGKRLGLGEEELASLLVR